MAKYYWQFSEVIDDLTVEERIWLENVLKNPFEADKEALRHWAALMDLDTKEARKELIMHEMELWPDFGFKFEDLEDGSMRLWLHDRDGYGSTEDIVLLVQTFLRKFRPGSVWSMEWSMGCDRPKIGAFGGGGVVISATEEEWIDTSQQVYEIRVAMLEDGVSS